MPKRSSARIGSELFIVDNSEDDWKALRYLKDWCQLSKSIDIASGFFEVGALLALDGEWQKLDKIRILMGDEVSRRTKRAFEAALATASAVLDGSLEGEKQKNHFLRGVGAIVAALRDGKIECRVYRKDKFHAKAYITHARMEVVGSSALVGSSNFTLPGLTDNIELNVQVTGAPVAVLQEWYDEHWDLAEDVTPEILKTFERHVRQYAPFEIYSRSLQQYFLGHEETASEWEKDKSRIFPVLARYQQDGYGGLLKRAEKYGGAFLCDGVGLGKTFIGLMLIERFAVLEKKNVALFVPKSAKKPVWERELRKRLPDVFKGYSRLKIFSHTDLMRKSEAEELDRVAQEADIIIIDEAHHFRNTGTKGEDGAERKSRYWRLYDLAEGKQMFLLTATPINNRLTDFQHMVELFTRHKADHFAGGTLGIHSLPGYIRQLEKKIEAEIFGNGNEQEQLELNTPDVAMRLSADPLFDALVVQRSRSYVKESMKRDGDGEVMFPEPRKPTVAEYSVRQTYGKLLDMVAEAFNRRDPLFVLGIYNPYAYYKGDSEDVATALEIGRLKQVVALIRTSFLKRFESSAEAFKQSCWRLLMKMLAWMEVHCETEHEKAKLNRWKRKHAKLLDYTPQKDMFEGDDSEDDLVSPELLEAVVTLSRKDFKVDEIIDHTLADLEQVADFLNELEKFKPSQDLKLKKLIQMLTKDPVLSKHKVLIFSEFGDTARYVAQQLKEAGVEGVEQIDSGTKGDRATIIQRFAPYYNESSSAEQGDKEIRVLVSTDVLSEGLNLQDATRLINYDLHWNPVRLMQRIGRVDRRMNPVIEAQIVADHPDQKALRGTVAYWNFLPPEDLEVLLRLYGRVAHKTLRISKTLGIEGRQLLREDDDYEDLRNFSEQYEGQRSPDEDMHLEWQDLLNANPGLDEKVSAFPNGIFSGKQNLKPGTKQVFFCYARPAHDKGASEASGEDTWTVEAGDVQWYLYDVASGEIREDAPMIVGAIRSTPNTPRVTQMEEVKLSDIRIAVEKHIGKTFLRKVQAPLGVKPVLRAWMELN
ncbi:MAG: DEAD/DEAH box helicase family protein [Sphingomonadales bacterium]|nr:DEAD/DEAH box helicase family protein [Sphingomonadales bacterium]